MRKLLDTLTEQELVQHYQDDVDPVIRRLCGLVAQYQQVMSDGLHGMPLHYDEEEGYICTNEGRPLHRYIEDLERDIEIQEDRIAELERELRRLETRTVVQLLADMDSKIVEGRRAISDLGQALAKSRESEKHARERLDMWTTLSRNSANPGSA